jgi:hypothetical protein
MGVVAHEHQQFKHGQHSDHQFERGGNVHPDDVQGHEHEVGAHGRYPGIQVRVLHIQIGTDGHGDGRRRENEFDQRGHSGDHPAGHAEGSQTVGEGTACVGDRRGQLGEAEDEAGVHHGHHQRGHQKAQGSGRSPAVAPAEILTGDHQAYRNAP